MYESFTSLVRFVPRVFFNGILMGVVFFFFPLSLVVHITVKKYNRFLHINLESAILLNSFISSNSFHVESLEFSI